MKQKLVETKYYNDRIRYAREYRGITKTELAKHLGILRQQYSRYEDGTNLMPAIYIKPICEFLNVSADYILGLSNEIEQIKIGTKN